MTISADLTASRERCIDAIAGRPPTADPPVPAEAYTRFVRDYFSQVTDEDLLPRDQDLLSRLVGAHYCLGRIRQPGETLLRITPPGQGDAGGSTVIQIVTDDKPFLVDTVSMVLTRRDWTTRSLYHPQLRVERAADGDLREVTRVGRALPGGTDESWISVEVFPPLGSSSGELIQGLSDALRDSLELVRVAVADWQPMKAAMLASIDLLNNSLQPVSPHEVRLSTDLLEWLSQRHFVLLGYREYTFAEGSYRTVPGSGLGILRGEEGDETAFHAIPLEGDQSLVVMTKDSRRSPVHRPVYLDYVGVRLFDRAGAIVGERRFLGLLSAAAYNETVSRIPVLAAKAATLMAMSGFDVRSYGGHAMWQVINTYPRDELFQAPVEQLFPILSTIAQFRERRLVRLFVRRGTYGRFLSCTVFMPRDRYTTEVRLRVQGLLMEALGGESFEYQGSVTESVLARLFVVIKRPDSEPLLSEVDVPALQARIEAAVRSWDDDFNDAAVGLASEDRGVEFSDAYEEEFPAAVAVEDLKLANRLTDGDDLAYDLYTPLGVDDQADLRFKVFRFSPMSLTDVMPHLSALGVEVIDERPYEWWLRGRTIYLYDFGLTIPGGKQALSAWDLAGQQRFIDAFDASYRGRAESGKLNRLIMTAGLTWRQVTWLRGMSRYLQQAGVPFSQPYIAGALNEHAPIAAALVRAFEIAFDPDSDHPDPARRVADFQGALAAIEARLAGVASLDQDRILRMFVALLKAMVRTNAFAEEPAALAFKLRPRELVLLPEPRPMFEIFVYSPRVQGVHLRFGPVARGGLRWSDRKEDFRTEVLGLVKAQMVKNTVIVPVGAKGGFVPQRLPDPAADRAAWQAEGIACYEIFVAALLSLTDNISGGAVVPPPGVVRHDTDDPYLVVAADKGTATFSDLANKISVDHGFWLGDAFASGGSAGYDHKRMGITARGAWESVKRHFVEMGRDCQGEDFTCVGIGDMAGDVFGNGMLLSPRTRLVAAFNHLHVFLDPDPDPGISFAERKRLFELPRSTWADYNPELLSEGGGVFSRSMKAIPVGARARESLGIAEDVTSLTPAELISAMLRAPVDLLWNGGIGTYVKASTETHAEVGDKANDALRVNGAEVRARCAGEGGNLGWTQRGRVEYASRGGRLNTDFIDNSAGVDTSDHEVNIKILLADQVAAGSLGLQKRNELLASMTEEVARLVLAHNVEQNLALANSMQRAVDMAGAHESWMQALETAGYLDRQLEYLPSSAEMAARIADQRGLTRPELSTLLAYTKINLKDQVLATALPEDPYLADRLIQYFPRPLAERYAADMPRHRLAREIITTVAVNRFVNSQGITAYHRLSSETGAPVSEVIRAQLAARSIFAVGRSEISLARGDLDADVVTELRMALRRMVERVTRWLLANRKPPLDILGAIAQFTDGVAALRAELPRLVTSREHARASQACERWVGLGVGQSLAEEMTHDSYAHFALTIVDIAQRLGLDLHRVADTYFRLSEALTLDLLLEAIISMSQLSKWDTMARAALRDDLLSVHGELTASVLNGADPATSPTAVVQAWMARTPTARDKAAILRQISEAPDVARISVGVRMVRSLLI